MYNKRFFQKINDKKVLHKIGKRWAVLSVSLLGALGLTGLVTSHAHASNVDGNTPNSASANNHQTQSSPARLIQPSQSSQVKSANSSNLSSSSEANGVNAIKERANVLYQSIIAHGMKHLNSSQVNVRVAPQNGDTNGNTNVMNDKRSQSKITGQWGTAPFQFDPDSGQLQTTGKGTIKPLRQLSQIPFSDVKSIQFAPGTLAPNDSTGLFEASDIEIPTTDGHYGSDSIAYVSALRNLKQIDLTNLNTNQVTSMAQMFGNDSGLQRIVFGPRFNTVNVDEMAEMFQSDNDLKSLDLSPFDTSNVLDMSSMFKSDDSLSDLNLGNHFNTRRVNYMSDMFQSDNDLRTLDLGPKFYLNYPKSLSHMFVNDYALTSLNLGTHFNTQAVTNMSDMFANDSDLNSLDLGPVFYTAQVSDMHDLFKDDANLQALNLGSYFDTTKASTKQYTTQNQVTANSYNGAPGAYESYAGSKGIFNGDQSLNRIQMTNAKLVGSVDLSTPALTAWYLSDQGRPEGMSTDLNDEQPHSGTYLLSSTEPVVTTDLNFQDINHNDRSIGDVLINGLKGSRIPFAVISNALGAGYVSAISIPNLMKTFPNTPYHYQLGVVNIPVKKAGNESTNGNSSPVTPNGQLESNAVNNYLASLADQKIVRYYQSSVASSVSVANQQRADLAARAADRRIDDSIADSAAHSADLRIERSMARSYVNSADQRIEASERASVADSVSVANQQRAKLAASSADQKLENSIADSAASSADQRIDSSIAESAAQSADRSLTNSIARSAAHSADVQIERSITSSYVSSADQRIKASEQSSVADSVSIANQQRARIAAESADRKIKSSEARALVRSTTVKNVTASSNSSSIQSVSSLNISNVHSSSQMNSSKVSSSISSNGPIKPAVQSAKQSVSKPSSESTTNSIDGPINHLAANSIVASVNSQTVTSERASAVSPMSAVNQRMRLSQEIAQLEVKPRAVHPMPVALMSQTSASRPVTARRMGRKVIYDNNDRNVPVNQLSFRQKLMIGKRTVTRSPVRVRKIRLKHRCVVHGRLIHVSHVRDGSRILKRGTSIRIEKKFRVRTGHEAVNVYEILANHQQFFVNPDDLFPTRIDFRPNDLRHYHRYGKAWHRYYRAVILRTCSTYRHGHRKERLHRDSIVHVKKVFFAGHKDHRQEYLMLTNGRLITADRKYFKFI